METLELESAPSAPATPSRPEVASAFVLLVLVLAIMFGVGVVSAIAALVYLVLREGPQGLAPIAGKADLFAAKVQSFSMQPGVLIPTVAVQNVMFLAATLLVARWRGGFVTGLRLGRGTLPLIASIAAVLGGLGYSQFLSFSLTVMGWLQDGPILRLAAVFARLDPLQTVGALLVIGVLAGTVEELIFRGLLQRRFVARWGRWPGILLASFFFGLIHFDPVHATFAFLFGIGLGWLAEVSGGVRLSVAVHVLNNCLAVILPRWFDPQAMPHPADTLFMAALALWGFWSVKRALASQARKA